MNITEEFENSPSEGKLEFSLEGELSTRVREKHWTSLNRKNRNLQTIFVVFPNMIGSNNEKLDNDSYENKDFAIFLAVVKYHLRDKSGKS